MRRNPEDTLLAVCNFVPVAHEAYRIGVPFRGKYKEIFNSDAEKYGGTGEVRKKIYKAEAKECDGRPYSFAYKLPPYGVAVFEF